MTSRAALGAIAIGGALGSLGRSAVADALPRTTADWPWATLLVNLAGCLFIGLIVARLAFGPEQPPLVRPFAVVGVLGGWTTYSAFAVETVELANAGRPGLAIGYVAASVLGGALAVALGHVAGQRIWSGGESAR